MQQWVCALITGFAVMLIAFASDAQTVIDASGSVQMKEALLKPKRYNYEMDTA